MEESIRLAYLEAMGIESWVFQQANLPPDNADSEVLQNDLNRPEYHEVGNSNSEGFQKKNPALPEELSVSDNHFAEQKPHLAVSSQLKSTSESLAHDHSVNSESKNITDPYFAFVSLWTSEGALLLVELQDSLAPGLSSSEYALLESILFALKQKPAIDVPLDKELFSWPALVGAHQDRSAKAAKQAVKAFVNGKIKRQGLQILLLLGKGVTHQAEEFLADKGSVEVVSTISLSEMLINPSSKASVWESIQALG